MGSLAFTTEIRAPPEKVFAFVSNGENAPRWHRSIKVGRHLTPTPIRVGTLLEVHAHLGRKDFGWVQEVTEWAPPHRFTDRMVTGRRAEGKELPLPPFREFEDHCEIEPRGAFSGMRFRLHYVLPYGPFGSLIDWLFLRSRVRRETQESLLELKKLLESDGR